jgi:predicted CopG family antitoxin
MYMSTSYIIMVKTTIILRDDIYAKLKQKYGSRGISEAVNDILSDKLFQEKSMFGTMKKTDLRDLRDHRDHE